MDGGRSRRFEAGDDVRSDPRRTTGFVEVQEHRCDAASDGVVHVWTDGGHVGHPVTQDAVAVQLAVPAHNVLQELTHVWLAAQANPAPLHPAQLGMHAAAEAQK